MFFQNLRAAVGAFLSRHVAPFFDPTALMLWAFSVGILLIIDPVMVKTLVQWTLFFLALAGAVVVVSRLTFPYVNLREHVEEARRGNTASGLVVLMVGLFMAAALIAIVLWAKA